MPALAAALLTTVAACRARPAAVGKAFTDEVGRRVVPLHVPARRVVSLAPNVTEMLFAVGAGPSVVGVDAYSDQPAEQLAGRTRVGSNYEPSVERIVGLRPDVVFTSLSANRRETVEALSRLGVPVFVTDTRMIADFDRTMRNLGALCGRAREAESSIGRLHAGLDDIRRASGNDAGERPAPRVLVVVWDQPIYVAGRGTFTDDLLTLAGGTNALPTAHGFAQVPLETILRSRPDLIVVPGHSSDLAQRVRASWSRWTALPAVAQHRIVAIDDDLITRPGPRLVLAARRLATLIQASLSK